MFRLKRSVDQPRHTLFDVAALRCLFENIVDTCLLCVKSLCEIGCWTDLVHYCAYRIEESIEETALEDLDEDSAVVH